MASYPGADVRDAVAATLADHGMPKGAAKTTADALVLAEVWGVGSHGLIRLPHYLRRLAASGYNPAAMLRTVSDLGALVVLDGDGGLGHWQLRHAAELGVDRARQHGVSAVAVGDSGHCGALGLFTVPALDAGMAALVVSNGPAIMPAWGGATPLLSTSPLAFGLAGDPPVIVDMASTAVARGKIAAAAAAGSTVPDGWALDCDGAPTTDAQAALMGMLAPLGGAKGFALAMAVESLTGVLIGPRLSGDVADMFAIADDTRRQGLSHLIVTLNAEALDHAGDEAAAGRRAADLAGRVAGSGGRLPGARRAEHLQLVGDEQISVSDDLAVVLGLGAAAPA
ncbi:oxidoreductase [Microlunatus phosphovorus NM-1]|uniref:Oxidoreductase n=1 Tax=Microlunatus phosphovorus (strain ATCC 700054 / DSM 10555 / JCM 9379 / NBRC 101784 / NCIMB 13414 / VKM Ac-1990 / NM-1) TaxID=1032480 RepID=F5XE05_MICPN|nr:Ldh family oxidoreductase [Microlunatus phosphovorus]BAK35178.1 oxidoreductase [Microlunatus phosphovorus NM-1]